jgi:hypothetical protein
MEPDMDTVCDRCGRKVLKTEAIAHPSGKLCEDCFIDFAAPAMGKMTYESDPAWFMQRLKASFIACPQRYH